MVILKNCIHYSTYFKVGCQAFGPTFDIVFLEGKLLRIEQLKPDHVSKGLLFLTSSDPFLKGHS